MIILDTNVVSEPLRTNPDPAVQHWLNRQRAETFFLIATNLAKLLVDVGVLPATRRRNSLSTSLSELLEFLFGTRVRPFAMPAAIEYPECMGRARTAAFRIGVADAQIAAIAAVPWLHRCASRYQTSYCSAVEEDQSMGRREVI